MSLCQLSVEHFRNLQSVQLAPAAGLNVIFGDNAAGKTSLLEAIFFLGRARSFRSGRPEHLISRDAESLIVRALIASAAESVRVGIQRSSSETRVRVDGEEVRSLSALARHLPVQVINNESQRLLQDGPQARRSFLSWGVFHVEHEYHGHWRRYERALRQRNAALRSGDLRLARSWEPELVATAESVTYQRQRYVEQLVAAAEPLLALWLAQEELSFSYRRGWAADKDLALAFEEGREREMEAGYTLYGPHRADLSIRGGGMDAQHRLSRGQQKLLAIALLIAQTQMGAHGGGKWILLLDDLPAELDLTHRAQVLASLQDGAAQCFITCTEREAIPLPPEAAKWFHVEHGVYREMI
jgi:DNA replication and repair protein RecF